MDKDLNMHHQKRLLTIIGTGIDAKNHLTLQAIDCLKQADYVLCFSDPELEQLLKKTNVKTIGFLDDLYEDGGIDDNNYSSILHKIKQSLLLYKHVVVALPGNPRLGVSICDMIREAVMHDKNIALNILPAISSFESMIIDADCDPLEHGSVIVDANRLLLFNYPIQTFYDYFMYHVCSIGTRETNVSNPQKNNHIDLLQTHLLKFYSLTHPCTFIKSLGNGINSSQYFQTTIGEMHKAISFIDFVTSLYIPSTGYPPENEEFLNLLIGNL